MEMATSSIQISVNIKNIHIGRGYTFQVGNYFLGGGLIKVFLENREYLEVLGTAVCIWLKYILDEILYICLFWFEFNLYFW